MRVGRAIQYFMEMPMAVWARPCTGRDDDDDDRLHGQVRQELVAGCLRAG
jgi:hypothetical protein